MKNLLFIFLAITCMFLVSCSDNEDESKTEYIATFELPDIDLEQRSVTDCGVIPELCPKPYIIQVPHEEEPGPIGTSGRIVINTGGVDYQIEPLNHYEDSKQFSVRTEEAVYVISDNEDEFVRSYGDQDIFIPNCIYQVFALDSERFSEDALTEEEVSMLYEGREVSTEESTGRILVGDFFSSTVKDDCPPPSKRIIKYDWCSWRKSTTINRWLSNMFPGFATMNPLAQGILRQHVTDAVNGCENDTETCFDCIDSRCILNALDENPLIGDLAKDEMKLNYLILLLDLGDEEKMFLKQNTEYLNELLSKHNLKSTIGCSLESCGWEGADNAHLSFIMAGISLSTEEQSALCNIYTELFNDDPLRWRCLRKLKDPNLNYMLIHFDSFTEQEQEDILNSACSGIILDFPEVENGITITNIVAGFTCSGLGTIIANSEDRSSDGDPDLLDGFDGDPSGILLAMKHPDTTTEKLYEIWRDFMSTYTFGNFDIVVDDMIDHFKDGNKEDYENLMLNHQLTLSPDMRDYIKIFGQKLNDELKGSDGKIDNIFIDLGRTVKLNSPLDWYLLVNDTEYVEVNLLPNSYSISEETGVWEGEFCFTVRDNFGVDKGDVTSTNLGPFTRLNKPGFSRSDIWDGFAAWWMLQHQRNQHSFVNFMTVNATIKGKI